MDAKDIFGLVFGGCFRWFQSCQLRLSFGNRLVRQFARCRPQQHRHHHQCLCHLVLQPGVSLLRWVGWTWYKSQRMNTLLQTYSWHLKHGDWKMSFLLGRHPARCPSSQNHGSVENGCVSKIRFLSFRVIFHWTVIMGERVLLEQNLATSNCLGYWWWKKTCTIWDVKNIVNNGKNSQPQLVQDFFHQQHHPLGYHNACLLSLVLPFKGVASNRGFSNMRLLGKEGFLGSSFFRKFRRDSLNSSKILRCCGFCVFLRSGDLDSSLEEGFLLKRGIFQPFNPNFFHLW